MFQKEEKTLLISDIHLGKITHFRKNGIALPPKAAEQNFIKLEQVILQYQPRKLIILGDLFHSDLNKEWDDFANFVLLHEDLEIILIKGNHDFFPNNLYGQVGIQVHNRYLLLKNEICLIHDPNERIDESPNIFYIGGHIHPGIRLTGKGLQSMRLPCFHLRNRRLIMPAFGYFTGLYIMDKRKDDQVFVIANDKIVRIGN